MGPSTHLKSPCTDAGRVRAAPRPADVELTLPARPESVATARREVARLGEQLGYSERRVDDLRTVISEACMNAAVHAYADVDGEIEVHATPRDDNIAITVSDRGVGIRPRPSFNSPSARLGILLIAALASSIKISSRRDGGTRLGICFAPDQP